VKNKRDMAIVKESIIEDFERLQKDLKKYLESGAINKKTVYEGCKMSKQTLDRKLLNKSFTAKELMVIAKFLNKLHV
jgi:hypothetical protein